MKKLNQKKIRWIIREMKKGERSVYRIAKIQGITPRWARELYRLYQEAGQYPYPRRSGRKLRSITDEERSIVLTVRKEHPLSPVTLEKILDERGIHIPHNRIYRILKEEGFVKDEPHKQRRRKWIRYERRYSNSLWHADWFEEQKDQIILVEDDASRFITGFGVFRNATSKNASLVLEKAIKDYGIPKQLMTDHGVQFTSFPRETCKNPRFNMFQQTLQSYGIKHIKSRVKHPQSNGKVERVYQTIRDLRRYFSGWEGTISYYNYCRPHSSLENSGLRTPYEAYLGKMRKSNRIG